MSRLVWTFAVLLSVTALLTIQSIRVERLKADLRDARQEVTALHEAREAAVTDAEQQAEECTARVAEARRSARAISTLLNQEIKHDEAGCPRPRVLDAGELRQALQPDASPAEPLR